MERTQPAVERREGTSHGLRKRLRQRDVRGRELLEDAAKEPLREAAQLAVARPERARLRHIGEHVGVGHAQGAPDEPRNTPHEQRPARDGERRHAVRREEPRTDELRARLIGEHHLDAPPPTHGEA